MSKVKRFRSPKSRSTRPLIRPATFRARGQALVEYALITALLVIAIMVALAATGPAVGNIFSNTVFNLIGGSAPSITPLNPTQFWQLVTAVASYTPSSIILPTNTLAPATSSPTVGPSQTPTDELPTSTPTITSTPGPSPTPEDIIHNAPFYDNIDNQDWWRPGTESVFTGYDPWSVEWWTLSSSQRNTTYVESRLAVAPSCTSSYDQPDIVFYWGSSGPTPGGTCSGAPWRTDDFATRWTRNIHVESDTPAKLTTTSDDGIRVYVDGALVNGLGTWGYHGEITQSVDYTFTSGDHTVVVEFFEGSGGATMVFTIGGASEDVGTCSWTMSDEAAHSAPAAWNDSPGRDYSDNSTCHLALRGAVNLASLIEPPKMTFWNRWDLDYFDKAWLQIREYGSAGPWYGKIIHENYQEQLAWMRETIDLASFDAINSQSGATSTIDWSGKTIEFRFVLEADASQTENGWWIDDIAIENNTLRTYTIGFSDTLENGDGNWLPSGSWSVSSERTRSGSKAWSDSPGAYYSNNANTSLELDGVVDLTVPESVTPELVFYNAWYLGAGDNIYAEVSTDRNTWVSLTPERTNGALQSGSRNDAFTREAISLQAYDGTVFYLRFRLQADNSDSKDGWWIDDIVLQNRPSGTMPYPFFDNMENGGSNWLADGTWTISPEEAYSGASSWSDSPGTNYADASNSRLSAALPFQLRTTQATRPELSFWYKHDIGNFDKLYLEVSTNDGSTWTSIWSYQYTTSTSSASFASGVPLNEFNTQLAWERVSVDMTSYISDTTPFLLRFRLDALTNSETKDGVWIDDIRLAEYVETPYSVPFSDDMEGTTRWRAGGQWALSTETAHSGAYAWSDSPGANYQNNTWSVLELTQPIDLTGLAANSFPILTFWDRFSLDKYDYARVQVSTFVGPGWSNWSPWTEVYQQYYTATLSWDRQQVDLRSFIGKKIRIRFVMDAMRDSATDPGWWIDDVGVSLYTPTVFNGSFYDGAESLVNWIPDGTWGLGDIFRGAGSGPAALGPGSWSTYFYDLQQWSCGSMVVRATAAITGSSCSGHIFTLAAQASLPDIDFDCGTTSSPNPNGTCDETPWKANHDYMAILFRRTINVAPGQYEFTWWHDDGARFYIDGNLIYDFWTDTGTHNETRSEYLSGTHVLEVWYYENTGGSVIQMDVARQSFSFHDSPDGDYTHLDNMSLTLNGVVNMTGTTNPSLTWYDKFDVDDNDCMIVEVSLPFESGQFNRWIEIYRRCYQQNNNWTLRNQSVRGPIESALGLSSGSFNFTNKLLTFRFRLDARVSSATDPGWWIDDVILAD